MGVRLKKNNGKWYVFINWHGRRKARRVGSSREVAEQGRREIEKRLTRGTFDFSDESKAPSFADCAKRWVSSHVRPSLKPSTVESYEVILKVHLVPRFGGFPIDRITRHAVRTYLAEVVSEGKLARNTVKNVFAILRALFSHAVEDGLVEGNPALRLGRFNRSQAEGRKVEFLTREEAECFLAVVRDSRSDRHPFFMTALRAGLKLGELLALEWDDIQFGEREYDKNRYILVCHNIVRGQATSPKSRKARRVDLSRELRRVLMELRDSRILEAVEQGDFDQRGQPRISNLVFPSEAGGPLDSRNVHHRDFLPSLEAAGLHRVTFHALRHSFGSMLLQDGASPAYVKDQMGHSSIQVLSTPVGTSFQVGTSSGWTDWIHTQVRNQMQPRRNQEIRPFKWEIQNSLKRMAGVEGLEPPALGLEIRCSILLSYTPERLL